MLSLFPIDKYQMGLLFSMTIPFLFFVVVFKQPPRGFRKGYTNQIHIKMCQRLLLSPRPLSVCKFYVILVLALLRYYLIGTHRYNGHHLCKIRMMDLYTVISLSTG